MDDTVIGLLIAIGLVLLNAFFVAAEFSLVSVRRTRIETLIEEGHANASVVMEAIKSQDRYIAATQLGITLASLGLGWVGEPALGHIVEPILEPLMHTLGGEADAASNAIAIGGIISFSIITFLHVVIGELMPKSIALQNPEKTSLWVARPTRFVVTIFRLPIFLLNGLGNFLLRLIGVNPAAGHEMVHSVEELKLLIRSSAASGIVEDTQQDIVEAVFEMSQTRVHQRMVPRTEITAFQADTPLDEVIDLVASEDNTLSKFPVYEDDLDQVIGILHTRDLLHALHYGDRDGSLRALVRPALEVSESITIGDLLTRFRGARRHMAILLDEYGGTAGLITLEDLLEEIVGDVQSPFEGPDTTDIQREADGTALVNGLLAIDEVNEAFDLTLSSADYETLAGYVLGKLDRLAKVGDEVEAGAVRLRVEEMDELRIAWVRLIPKGDMAVAVEEEKAVGSEDAPDASP